MEQQTRRSFLDRVAGGEELTPDEEWCFDQTFAWIGGRLSWEEELEFELRLEEDEDLWDFAKDVELTSIVVDRAAHEAPPDVPLTRLSDDEYERRVVRHHYVLDALDRAKMLREMRRARDVERRREAEMLEAAGIPHADSDDDFTERELEEFREKFLRAIAEREAERQAEEEDDDAGEEWKRK